MDIQRRQLVEQIRQQGIRDRRVLGAIGSVPREAFVPSGAQHLAYRNTPLPIGNEQTISQPFIVALMAAALELQPSDRVLEVGTGSGYAAAVLSQLCAEVYSIERFAELAESAKSRLRAMGFRNVHVRQGDGSQGWPEQAPFDAITVAACGLDVPFQLQQQLAIGGRLVMPLGDSESQELMLFTRTGAAQFEERALGGVRFVPLITASGSPPTR